MRKHPDFTVSQFWGPDVNNNPEPDVVHILIEVGSSQEDKWNVACQVQENLDFLGERYHDEILGVAIVQNKVLLVRNNDQGGFDNFVQWMDISVRCEICDRTKLCL